MRKLIPDEMALAIPSLIETAEWPLEQMTVHCRISSPFLPGFSWWIYAFDETSQIAMGFVNLGDPWCAELGYVDLIELAELRLPGGLRLELDPHFVPTPLTQIIDQVRGECFI